MSIAVEKSAGSDPKAEYPMDENIVLILAILIQDIFLHDRLPRRFSVPSSFSYVFEKNALCIL